MSKFFVRVELNGPPQSDVYEDLHSALSRNGFERIVHGRSGRRWMLPNASYIGRYATDDAEVARDAITRIVDFVWDDCEIFVCNYDNAAWIGLTPLTDS